METTLVFLPTPPPPSKLAAIASGRHWSQEPEYREIGVNWPIFGDPAVKKGSFYVEVDGIEARAR